jgi:glyoxylase-like metal-dependent hydrolase (beta-lactamase superfamily II)
MKIFTLILGDMLNCVYIVANNNEALIIDPSWDMPAIYKLAEKEKLTPKAVLLTHGHYDHLYNAAELLKKYNIKAYIEENDKELSALPEDLLITFKGDYKADLIGLSAEFIHTPGHTGGSVSIKINDSVFTGDTLFPGACGRTDLPGSNPRDMQLSLERLAHLPPGTKVYSGHAYGPDGGGVTTIGDEVKNNPFVRLSLKDAKAFEKLF